MEVKNLNQQKKKLKENLKNRNKQNMDPETLKEIQDQLDSLPKKVREVITSINISNEIAKLKTKHRLMLDQVSTLEIETMLVMIGLEPADDFINNIKSNLGVDDDRAISIATDINELIFEKIRKAMMSLDESEEKLDRESILNEIENPTPTFPITKTEAPPQTPNSIPEIAPTQVIQKYAQVEPIKSVVEKKLSEPTHTTPKETEVFLKKIPPTTNTSISSSQKRPFDPYKEPIE